MLNKVHIFLSSGISSVGKIYVNDVEVSVSYINVEKSVDDITQVTLKLPVKELIWEENGKIIEKF